MRLRQLLKSKIHRATVTEADVNYVGSITIDQDLMERADLWPGELVHVWNATNGRTPGNLRHHGANPAPASSV